jgi:hypothetical protein
MRPHLWKLLTVRSKVIVPTDVDKIVKSGGGGPPA